MSEVARRGELGLPYVTEIVTEIGTVTETETETEIAIVIERGLATVTATGHGAADLGRRHDHPSASTRKAWKPGSAPKSRSASRKLRPTLLLRRRHARKGCPSQVLRTGATIGGTIGARAGLWLVIGLLSSRDGSPLRISIGMFLAAGIGTGTGTGGTIGLLVMIERGRGIEIGTWTATAIVGRAFAMIGGSHGRAVEIETGTGTGSVREIPATGIGTGIETGSVTAIVTGTATAIETGIGTIVAHDASAAHQSVTETGTETGIETETGTGTVGLEIVVTRVAPGAGAGAELRGLLSQSAVGTSCRPRRNMNPPHVLLFLAPAASPKSMLMPCPSREEQRRHPSRGTGDVEARQSQR